MISTPRAMGGAVRRRIQSGFTLMELMIALTLGLLLSGFMVAIVVNTNTANLEVDKSNRQIENGRYASEVLRDDIRLAGYYGDYSEILPPATAASTVCNTTTAGLLAALALPIESISSAPANALAACPGSPVVLAGTDVIIVRRVDTNAVCGAGTTPAAPTAGDFYVQSTTAGDLFVQVGAAGFVFGKTAADATATTASQCKRVLTATEVTAGAHDNSCPTVSIAAETAGNCTGFTAAAIRKLHVDYYFVSPCNFCGGTRTDTTPTLKHVYLTSGGFAVEPLVEGIENLHIEFGVDNSPPTDAVGFGSPDVYVDTPATLNDWANVVAVRVHVLARNVETTNSYSDTKTYVLGSRSVTPGGAYKRHAFSSLIRLENLAARRETPT
jgi:type IV pilus assembly protein PilW